MLRVELPKDIKKLERCIETLKYQISVDTNEIDRRIHEDALENLEAELKSAQKPKAEEAKLACTLRQEVQFAVRVNDGVITGIGKSVAYLPKVQKKEGRA